MLRFSASVQRPPRTPLPPPTHADDIDGEHDGVLADAGERAGDHVDVQRVALAEAFVVDLLLGGRSRSGDDISGGHGGRGGGVCGLEKKKASAQED